jgi:hypothetical protein
VRDLLAETHARRLLLPRAFAFAAALALLCAAGRPAGAAEDGAAEDGAAGEVSKQEMRGLDEQVQEIKSDVLGIAAELSLLEEKLLYPSNTQVAVFVSLGEGETFRLDAVRIQIDGEPVAHHIYSFKELEALRKGGVQRIYTGNVPVGEHQIEIAAAGVLEGGDDFGETRSFAFRKDVEPALVGITLGGPDGGEGVIRLGEW